MVCFVFGLASGLALPAALLILGWRRMAPHLRENREASQALIDHVVFPLLGKKAE